MKAMQRNRNNAIPEESASGAIAALSLCLCDTLLAGGDHPAEAARKNDLSKPECHKPWEQPKEKPA